MGSVLNCKKRTTQEGDATQRQCRRNADRCVSFPCIAATPLNYEWGPVHLFNAKGFVCSSSQHTVCFHQCLTSSQNTPTLIVKSLEQRFAESKRGIFVRQQSQTAHKAKICVDQTQLACFCWFTGILFAGMQIIKMRRWCLINCFTSPNCVCMLMFLSCVLVCVISKIHAALRAATHFCFSFYKLGAKLVG